MSIASEQRFLTGARRRLAHPVPVLPKSATRFTSGDCAWRHDEALIAEFARHSNRVVQRVHARS